MNFRGILEQDQNNERLQVERKEREKEEGRRGTGGAEKSIASGRREGTPHQLPGFIQCVLSL